MIAIVNYGLGNAQAFANIYRRLGISHAVVATPDEVANASHVILPGVGSFDWAMRRLNSSGMIEELQKAVFERKCPFLGVCVGMQILANSSEEGESQGLGWIDGRVLRFSDDVHRKEMFLPHMGWNDVAVKDSSGLFSGLTEARFYFLHSYYVKPVFNSEVAAVTDYYGEFASSIKRGNVMGVQFHPEKSHRWGVQLLKNFSEM